MTRKQTTLTIKLGGNEFENWRKACGIAMRLTKRPLKANECLMVITNLVIDADDRGEYDELGEGI